MVYFILKGGSVMIPIILGSVLGLAIILDRLVVIHRVYRLDMESFSKVIYKRVAEGQFEEALRICRQNNNFPLPSIFEAGIENRELSRLDLEKMLERMGNHAVKNLEKRLGGLV